MYQTKTRVQELVRGQKEEGGEEEEEQELEL
jgi:hypothetical protein